MYINNISFRSRVDIEAYIDKVVDHINHHGCISVANALEYAGAGDLVKDEDRFNGWINWDDVSALKDHLGGYVLVGVPKTVQLLTEPKPDMVSHPPHYQSETGLEVIDVIKAYTSDLKGIEATDTGNIIKYICRWKHKNGVEDLKKAKWYLEHLIKEVE